MLDKEQLAVEMERISEETQSLRESLVKLIDDLQNLEGAHSKGPLSDAGIRIGAELDRVVTHLAVLDRRRQELNLCLSLH